MIHGLGNAGVRAIFSRMFFSTACILLVLHERISWSRVTTALPTIVAKDSATMLDTDDKRTKILDF